MKSRPKKSEALTAATDRASSEVTQDANQGHNVENSTALTVAGTSVRQVNGLYSLTDLHKASGAEAKHRPNYFLDSDQTQALIGEISKAGIPAFEAKRGNNGGTYACKELVIAYAAWISAAFHLKVIRVFLDAVQPAAPAIDNERIALAEAVAAEAVTQVYHAVFSAVMAGGEWWAHDRYLLSLRYDQSNKPTIPIARPFASGEMVVSMDKLPDMINGSDPVSCTDLQLARLAMACAKRQEFRAERRAEREGAQKQTPLHAMPAATKAIGGAA